jgi:hypothetical protein
MSTTLLLVISMLFCGTSCKNDDELFTEAVLLAEEEITIDLENAIVIPEDFDWTNIPETYKDSILDIQFDFDFNDETIELPEDITLYFSTGSFSNGELTGDNTTVISQTKYQVFDDIDLAGSYDEDQYLMPYWFGAVMDGVTDDRDVFVETLDQATNITGKVMIDKDIFLDVEETGAKSIFLDDNAWIEGDSDANIIINNLLSPAFYLVLVDNVTMKNFTFLYDNSYNASYEISTSDNGKNQQQLEDYLSEVNNIIFNSTNPLFKGSNCFRSILSIEGSEDILLENVNFKAKGDTANTFIQWVIKFKEQYSSNQTINDESYGTTEIPKNITLSNITLDGTIMGIQGNVEYLTVTNLNSYRYSDMQNADGSYLGAYDGVDTYNFPPPHLFYLNTDTALNDHYPNNIELYNIVDYGNYIGTEETRGASGYCNSLKMVGQVENVLVDTYSSYRRDGLGDLGNITNGTFKNMYAENYSDIFDASLQFKSLRFVGDINNTTIDNLVLKDLSEVAEIYPLDFTSGDSNSFNNIQVYVNEFNSSSTGVYGIFGSNNTILNSSLTIENHTVETTYQAVIYHDEDTLENGTNNYYDITVNGWRTIDEDSYGLKCRVMLANSSNTNTNYAKITDVTNNMVSEQVDNVLTDSWTRSEIVELGSGTSQELEINIPNGYLLESISVNTIEDLAEDVEISIGTSAYEKTNLLSTVSKTVGIVSSVLNETTAQTGTRSIYLFSDSDFDNTGSIEVTLVLTLESEYD